MYLVAENKATARNTDTFNTDGNGMIVALKTTTWTVLLGTLLNLTLSHTPTRAPAQMHIHPHKETQNSFRIMMAIFIFFYLWGSPLSEFVSEHLSFV